jgi:nuclear transport factor 2 (NTF2) superfamily protein
MLIAELLAGDVLLISTPMAVKFQYEWHDDNGQWYRSYGNEPWEFAPSGHATP